MDTMRGIDCAYIIIFTCWNRALGGESFGFTGRVYLAQYFALAGCKLANNQPHGPGCVALR